MSTQEEKQTVSKEEKKLVLESPSKKLKQEETKSKFSVITSKQPTKTINIQNDLEDIKNKQYTIGTENNTKQHWLKKKCKHYTYNQPPCSCTALSYYENIPVNVSHSSYINSFYGAFVNAYNNHEDVVLSPDDIMMCVNFNFSKYVNDNSEAMRKFLVSHEGKKKLTVTTWNETSESQWDEFFQLMIKAIAENTKNEIVNTLECKFSTTTLVEQTLSTACIMDTLKTYFSYGRCIPCCGIRNVHFMGKEEDWKLLKTKISKLKEFRVEKDKNWENYINGVLEILDEFIATYNGKVNKEWWNKIMNFRRGRIGSGSTSYVSGWILNFFLGLRGEVEASDIPAFSMDFPIEIDNKLTGVKKTVYLSGGMGGVAYENGAFRPQQSMIICEGDFEKA